MTTHQERLKNAALALGALQISDLGAEDLATTRDALDVLHKAVNNAGPELVDGRLSTTEVDALREGRILDAIKSVRARTDLGLAQAKDFVTKHGGRHRPSGGFYPEEFSEVDHEP